MAFNTDQASPEHLRIFNRIREIGKVFNDELPAEMGNLYASLPTDAGGRAARFVKDIPYGPDKRNLLDVYSGNNDPDSCTPVLVFFHGGGFISGDKSFHKNIGNYFASNNVLTVIPSYRLAPEYKWPSGAQDVASVVGWVRHNAAEFGGDPGRIFLMGHSAGAAHVATYLYFNEFHIDFEKGATGAILISGAHYDAKDINCPCTAYYGEDESLYPGMSVMNNIKNSDVTVFIMYAEFDPPEFDYQSIQLFNTIYYHHENSPFIKRIFNHNHISEIMQFNTGDDSIGPDILSFIGGIKS
jgi:acetyl esterase